MRSLLFATAAVVLLQAGAASAAPLTPKARAQMIASVDELAPTIGDTAQQIWGWAEMGYLEVRSSALLQSQLTKAGFKVEAGVAGEPTGFIARFSNGPGPVIAILGEFDALPGLSQQATPERKSAGLPAGHGCGHNLFGAGSMGAAIAVKQWMVANNIKGELRFYGTPAEESGGGKVYMARAGLFDDVDVTVHWHAGDQNSAAQNSSTANVSGKFRFHGIASHAAGAPERGRSALDAAEILDVAVNFMREHIPDRTRIHNVITRGGLAPNVVPDFAEDYYYVRQNDPKVVSSVLERIKKAAQGAAMATETTVDFELQNGVFATLPNDTLGRVMDRNLRAVGGVKWTPEEAAFAKAISEHLPAAPASQPRLAASEIAPYEVDGQGGLSSTDAGDVTWVTPSVSMRAATWTPGTPSHSWQAAAQSGTSMGAKGAVVAAKTMALTAAELFQSPDVIKAARVEFERRRGPDFKYVPLLGDRAPPLDYRKQAAEGGPSVD